MTLPDQMNQEGKAIFEKNKNPLPHLDYLVELNYNHQYADKIILIRYVPDKDVLTQKTFEDYCRVLNSQDNTPEVLTRQILTDFNDQILPRFIQITVGTKKGEQIILEDRQPGWDNLNFLRRLRKI